MKLPNYNKSKIWVDLFDQMNIYTIENLIHLNMLNQKMKHEG